MRSEQEASLAVEKHADTVRRICFVHLKNYHDVQDVMQDVFLKYLLHDKPFGSDEHEKAWIIRVTINACKDTLKSFFRKKVTSLQELISEPASLDQQQREILEAVLELPANYRNAIYLHYFEGYSAFEIAALLNRRENTIYTWLSRGRASLKTILGGDFFAE